MRRRQMWPRKSRCTPMASAVLPTSFGDFTAIAYRDRVARDDAVVLTMGSLEGTSGVPLRIHSECLTGEAFRSERCDCGDQLNEAMSYVARRQVGIIVYLRGHEGRGIGITNKLRAYALQDSGANTVSANLMLGLPIDARDYGAVPQILMELGVRSVELLSNNPDKIDALTREGVTVTGVRPSRPVFHAASAAYLTAKRDLLGHSLVLRDSS